MKTKFLLTASLIFLFVTIKVHGQAASDTTKKKKVKKYQAKAPATQPFGAEAFGPSNITTIRWLG